MLIWGITDLRKYKPTKKRSKKREFFSTDYSPPEVTFSYGQIIGGIMGIVTFVIWVVAYGF